MTNVDPKELMYWVDNWKDSNPGSIGGKYLQLYAIQVIKRLFRKKQTVNWIYRLGLTREIVYKPFPSCPAVMKMGISDKTFEPHPKSVLMETYAKYFIERVDLDWLKRNGFELV